MADYTLEDFADFKRGYGYHVQAFHPRTLGVVYHGAITKVGRKFVTVRFTVDNHEYRILPEYVTNIVAIHHPAD